MFSPQVAPGFSDAPASGLSCLRLIEQVWGLAPLTWRDAGAPSLLPLLDAAAAAPPLTMRPLPLPPKPLAALANMVGPL